MNLEQRRKLLSLTAASGSVPNLDVAVHAVGCFPKSHTFDAAAAAGSLDACQWLHRQGYFMSATNGRLYDEPLDGGKVLSAAAGGGHMHVCEWLVTLDLTWDWGAEETAAEGGHLALMEWLIQRRPQLRYDRQPEDVDQRKMLAAAVARGCGLPTLQRLWPHWGELSDEGKAGALVSAAGSPTPDWAAKVEWLEGQGCPRTQAATEEASAHPDALERLTWLRGRGYPLGVADNTVVNAALTGNSAAIQYLVVGMARPTGGIPFAAICAARGGHLPALQALQAAGWPLGGPGFCFASLEAARAGHLHVVAWLVEAVGAALLNGDLFAAAAESGSVELLAWLRQRGCGWDARMFNNAVKAGCEEALEWLAAQGYPVPEDGRLYLKACWGGDLATARCLRRLGVPWGDPAELLSWAVKFARPPMLRWLLEAGCPVDLEVAEAAAAALIRQAGRGSAGAVRAAEAQTTEALGLIRQHLQQQQQEQEQQGHEQQQQRQEAH